MGNHKSILRGTDRVSTFFQKYRRWRYSNTAMLILSLVLIYLFIDYPFIQNFIAGMGGFGYYGAFVAGLLFVSIFTVAPAGIILYDMANVLNPYMIAIIAGAGAVTGDYLIFRYLKDKVFYELKPVFAKLGGSFISKIFATPYFSWIVPLAGAFMVASPLPDEAGITMMGLSKIKVWQFLALTYALHTTGIFILVTAAQIF